MSQTDEAAAAELKKKRTFKKFTYRGVDLDQLLDLNRLVTSAVYPAVESLVVEIAYILLIHHGPVTH